MAKEIWNEGRVVGYSAYDIYVKQHLASQDADTPPATESEWLASSLTAGSSLLAKIPNINQGDTDHSYIEFELPAKSRLGAANTIVASFFDGDGNFPLNSSVNSGVTYSINGGDTISYGIWADKIIDYGELIRNDDTASPSQDGSNIPLKPYQWSRNKQKKLTDYMKLVDGIVIQPGEWGDTLDGNPKKDEIQDLSKRPKIRLHVRGKIENEPLVLFTGFSIRSVLSGTSILGSKDENGKIIGSTSPELREDETGFLGYVAPEDGDFLGPSVYPWANKIIFSVPNSYVEYFEQGKYVRELPTNKQIGDIPVIDMNSNSPTENNGTNTAINPYWFYSNDSAGSNKLPEGFKNNIVEYRVNEFSTLSDGTSVLTVYEKKSAYPPALYGTFVKSNGDNYLCPLDCVAPGSVKMFVDDTGTVMKDYENTFPGTVSMNKDSTTGEISTIININGVPTKIPVASLEAKPFGSGSGVKIKIGKKSAYCLAVSPYVTDNSDPQVYGSNGAGGTIYSTTGRFQWGTLTNALVNNKAIDLFKNGIIAGEGISISGEGPYTISYIDGSDSGKNVKFPSIEGSEFIDVSYDEEENRYTIINLAPNAIAGIKYHWIPITNSNLEAHLRANFQGARSDASIGGTSSIDYKNFLSASDYLKNGVRLGVNCESLTKNPTTGKYSGVMYFKIDFSGSISGVGTHLANKNLSEGGKTSAGTPRFQFLHGANSTLRRQQASIISVKFKGDIWGNLSTVGHAYISTKGTAIWNVGEVYKASDGKYKSWDPGASFFAILNMGPPQGDPDNPYPGFFTLRAQSYCDGYNDQFDKWVGRRSDGRKGHIWSRWINMGVEWCCNVTNVDKAAIMNL